MTESGTIRIGCASGFWGDAAFATPQLLRVEGLDFVVYDYLAEVTMSILARARLADRSKGYAVDFVTAAMAPNLKQIHARSIRVIANAGGSNPIRCAEALRAEIAAQALDLTVGVVLGDDLGDRLSAGQDPFVDTGNGVALREMFTAEPFPPTASVASVNAYLGAFPIAEALNRGADIVITGRCVDSAVTLGACIHAFGWQPGDLDLLARGSLAGHLLECGTQVTGGNFTDWEAIAGSLPEVGYPLAEIDASGDFEITKPADSGGLVSVGTVAEQMLYEIGDPRAYLLPDVTCDFSDVTLQQNGPDWVRVRGARGYAAPETYKVSATWADGFRAGHIWTMVGRDAKQKAGRFADAVLARTRTALRELGLPDLSEACVEIIGAESHFGATATTAPPREVDVKIAARHASAEGVAVFLREMTGTALAAPPGLCSFAGARARPSPVVRLFSFLLPKSSVQIEIEVAGERMALPQIPTEPGSPISRTGAKAVSPPPPVPPAVPGSDETMATLPLERLAYGRSGDKGDKANIGIIARDPAFTPWIAAALTEERVARRFAHFLRPDQARPVQRYYLPGTQALNFVLHDVLGGGGVASLRSDPQGKCYAQLLLSEQIPVPRSLVETATTRETR